MSAIERDEAALESSIERVRESGPVRKAKRHGHIMLLGLLVILVPIAVVGKSFEQAHKAVTGVVKQISPEMRVIEETSGAILVFVALALACWGIGWLMTRTERGKRWLEWEKAKFFKRSPMWQKHSKRQKQKADAESEAASSKLALPVLARAGGDWQPGVVLEESAAGLSTVFVPDVPSLATGRLYYLPKQQIVALDTSLNDFRSVLTAGGYGSLAWLEVLSEAESGATGEAAAT